MLKTEDKTWSSFRGGRYTRNNLVNISDDHLLIANQLYFPGDGILHKRPGYTLVRGGIGFNANRIFDFRRQSDGKQFIVLSGGGFISCMPADGTEFPANAVPLTTTTTLVAETGHNTSANPAYNKTNFPANFTGHTQIDTAGTLLAVDSNKVDDSFNPITPCHVSPVSVKTLAPNFGGKFYAHIVPFFHAGGGGGHVDIGVNNDSLAWVTSALTDIAARGFDGFTINWKASGSYQDTVTLLIQSYLATHPGLTYCVQIDPAAYATTGDLETLLAYLNATYFADPNYQKIGGLPVVHFFSTVGGVNYATAKAFGGFSMYWVMQGSAQLANAWADAVFDWPTPYTAGVPAGDPYNATHANSFLTAVHASAKGSIPSICPGFDGTLTADPLWSLGKYMPRDNGKCWVSQAAVVNANIPVNCIGIHVPTWNDWEEGSQIESAIDNQITVTASIVGTTLSWAVTGGTGDESTISEYKIVASPNGAALAELGTRAPGGPKVFDLSEVGVTCTIYVIAVGVACVRTQISAGIAYAGLNPFPLLSSGEDATARWAFATNVFGLYGSNGIKAYRFVDTGDGLLTRFNWGLQAPTAAPTLSTAAGTLTLEEGRQYAYSFVSKWTDAQGTQRIHVGPPSSISESTGPQTNITSMVGALQTSVDPQVTHLWIWATNDTPDNTTSALFFLAEIANGVASYGDALQDTSLDTTRLIPYDNVAPPPARIIAEYQQRFALSGIAGKPDLVQGTGLEEVSLGIPQETAPSSVFFNVPGGNKAISGMATFNTALDLSTEEFWFQVQGFSAETFEEDDKIFSPGMVGDDAWADTPTWLAWLGTDKKLWAWNGYGEPVEVSWKIARSDGSKMLSMESMSAAQLSTAQLRWFSWERHNLVMVLVSTGLNQYYDWFQLWDVSILSGPQGQMGGALTKDGLLMGAAEGDMFPSDRIVGSGNVLSGSRPYIYLADDGGNIYRWPDGFTDNGKQYAPVAGSEFTDHELPGFKKRYRWLDAITSRINAVDCFKASAVAQDGVSLETPTVACEIQPVPGPGPVDPTCFRAKLEQRGTAVGRFMRWVLQFPQDDNDVMVYKVEAKASIIGKDTR